LTCCESEGEIAIRLEAVCVESGESGGCGGVLVDVEGCGDGDDGEESKEDVG